MNEYVKKFFHRGLIFGGFGPIILGIIFAILGATLENFTISGSEILLAIVSTYMLAFLHAGASVFNQIEHWSIARSLACHFATLYLAYTLTYTLNRWIPFDPIVLLVFTGIFIGVYGLVWLVVVLSVKYTARVLNRRGR